MIGIITNYRVAANIPVTSSVVLVDATGLSFDLAASQIVRVESRLFFSVGATGGARAQLIVPAGGTLFFQSNTVVNVVADTVLYSTQAASAAVTDAFANAGTHWMDIQADIINGATAGTMKFQFAQNTSDALTMNLVIGSWMRVTVLQ